MDYLGALPLNLSIREQADTGRPTVVSDPDGEIAGLYKARGAPGGGEDRAAREGLLVEVPDHLDLEEHLRGRTPMTERPAVDRRGRDGARVPAQPLGGLAPSHRRGGADEDGLRRPRRACCATTASCAARCTRASRVELFVDEGEGYYLNLSSRRAGVVRGLAHRRRGSVARLARARSACRTTRPAAGSTRRSASTTCRCQPEWRDWLQAFTDEHYKPEPKQRKRPAVVPARRSGAVVRRDGQRGRRLPVALVAAQGAGARGACEPRRRRRRCPQRRSRRPAVACRRRCAAEAEAPVAAETPAPSRCPRSTTSPR